MKRILTLGLVLLVTVPMFSIVLPRVEAFSYPYLVEVGISYEEYSTPITPPITQTPRGHMRLWYHTYNPNSYSVNVILGASIKIGSTYYSDPSHDKVVTLYPGHSNPNRYFHVPSGVPSGSYGVVFAIWDTDWNPQYDSETRSGWVNMVSSVSVQLSSSPSNLGSITWDGITYSLPKTVYTTTRIHWSGADNIHCTPPVGYEFHHWEAGGDVDPWDEYSQWTNIDVDGSGSLKAVFKAFNHAPVLSDGYVEGEGTWWGYPDTEFKFLVKYKDQDGDPADKKHVYIYDSAEGWQRFTMSHVVGNPADGEWFMYRRSGFSVERHKCFFHFTDGKEGEDFDPDDDYYYFDVIERPDPCSYDEFFFSVDPDEFDSDGDGYDDAVTVEMDVDTTYDGSLTVRVEAYLYGPSGGNPVDSDSTSWSITKAQAEFGYVTLYVPSGSEVGWYDVELYLYDECDNYEDYDYQNDVLHYEEDLVTITSFSPMKKRYDVGQTAEFQVWLHNPTASAQTYWVQIKIGGLSPVQSGYIDYVTLPASSITINAKDFERVDIEWNIPDSTHPRTAMPGVIVYDANPDIDPEARQLEDEFGALFMIENPDVSYAEVSGTENHRVIHIHIQRYALTDIGQPMSYYDWVTMWKATRVGLNFDVVAFYQLFTRLTTQYERTVHLASSTPYDLTILQLYGEIGFAFEKSPAEVLDNALYEGIAKVCWAMVKEALGMTTGIPPIPPIENLVPIPEEYLNYPVPYYAYIDLPIVVRCEKLAPTDNPYGRDGIVGIRVKITDPRSSAVVTGASAWVGIAAPPYTMTTTPTVSLLEISEGEYLGNAPIQLLFGGGPLEDVPVGGYIMTAFAVKSATEDERGFLGISPIGVFNVDATYDGMEVYNLETSASPQVIDLDDSSFVDVSFDWTLPQIAQATIDIEIKENMGFFGLVDKSLGTYTITRFEQFSSESHTFPVPASSLGYFTHTGIHRVYAIATLSWIPLGTTNPIMISRRSYEVTITVRAAASMRTETHSPVNILVTDPLNRQVGFDAIAGEVVNEIEGATYSGPGTEPQVIEIPNPLGGTYIVDAYGIGTGSYTITMSSTAPDGMIIDTVAWTGTAEPEELYTETVHLEPEGTITLEDWVPYVSSPDPVNLEFRLEDQTVYIDATITFPDPLYDIPDWGTPVKDDHQIWADAEIWDWTGVAPLVITAMSHTYNLGHLEDGTYTFTFKAWGQVVKSTTFTIDTTCPTTEIDLTGTLGLDGWYVSDVTVTLTATDNLSGVAATAYSFDGTTWNAYTGPFTITDEGIIAIYYNSTDNAGNIEATKSSAVKIDKTHPYKTVDLAGTLGNHGWYISEVIIAITPDDDISGVWRVEYSFDGITSLVYTGPFTIDIEGIITVRIRIVDCAGNEETNIVTIKIDKTPPITTISLSGTFSNGWYTSDVTITLDAFDATSGVENTYYKVDDGLEHVYSTPFMVSGDGPHTIEFWSIDNAGNVETCNTNTFQIDTTAPITAASLSGTLGLNDWYVTSVQVTLTGEDPSESSIPPTGSGIYKTYYAIDGELQTEYIGPFTVSDQGSHAIEFWSVDVAGNTEVINTIEFKIDTIAPATIASQSPDGDNGWWKTSPATVALSASDTTSGVMEIHYQRDPGTYVLVPGASALVTVEGNGIHAINYYAVDHAGNQEAEKTETVKIDTISPTTTLDIGAPQFTIGPDIYVTSATSFTLSPLDNPEESGVAKTYYRVYPVSAMPPPFDSGTTFQIIGDDGEYTIEYYSTDNAGNEETLNSKTAILDNTPPITTKTVGSPSYDNFVTSATLICLDTSDSGAGPEGTYYRINGGSWISYSGCFTLSGPDGTYTIEFYSIDNLGNIESAHIQTHCLDNTAPSSSDLLSGTMGDNDWFISSAEVTLSANDGLGSGLATICYRLDDGDTEIYSTSLLVTEDGWHSIEFWSVDNLGNAESPHKTNFKIDPTRPSTSASLNPENPNGENDWYTVPVDVTLTAYDETSGVAATYYCINDGPHQPYSIPFTVPEDGVYTVQFWSTDNASNTETPNTISLKIDQTAPTTTLTIGHPKHGEDPTYVSPTSDFALEATDTASGVNFIEYKIDDGAWTPYTAPFNVIEFGPHTVYYYSIDNAGNVEEIQNARIVVAATSTEYLAETTAQYSDSIAVKAGLIDMATQEPIQGKNIIFTIGSQSETSVTNSEGIATASIILDQPAGSYMVSASFDGDEEYLGSSDSKPFTIEKEIAEVGYTGDTVVPTTANTINLRATVHDSDDGSWGDLTKIQVVFKIYTFTDLTTPVVTTDPIPVIPTDMPGVGVAVESIGNLNENGYIIIVSIKENDYYRGPTSDPTALTVYEPTGEFVTGGGWIWDPTGSKGNFGFNAKYTKSGKPKGHSIYVYREGGWNYIVKSNAWIGLAIDSEENHAYFEGKCVVQKYNPETEELVWDEGNYKFRVDAWDNDSDGGIDIYQIRALDKNGVPFHEAGFDLLGELQGGNIVIHDEKKRH